MCGLNIGLRSEDEKTQKKSILIDYLIRHLNVSQFLDNGPVDCKYVVVLLTFPFILIYSNTTCMPSGTGFVKFCALLM